MTFEREIMGLLCLGIVWLNTALVCGQAHIEFWQRFRLRRQLSRAPQVGQVGLTSGVIRVDCDEDIPRLELNQSARSRADGKIYFHDREPKAVAKEFRLESERRDSAPLLVRAGGDVREPEGSVAERTWVWVSRRRVRASLGCSTTEEFDALAPATLAARGAARVLCFPLNPGTRVYVAGQLSADGETLVPGGFQNLTMRDSDELAEQPLLLISEEDPRAVLKQQMSLIAAAVAGIGVVLIGLTALTLLPPVFGTTSKLGAFGLLLFLLLVQPLGVWLSEQVLPPHAYRYAGTWRRAGLPSRRAEQGAPLEPTGSEAASV